MRAPGQNGARALGRLSPICLTEQLALTDKAVLSSQIMDGCSSAQKEQGLHLGTLDAARFSCSLDAATKPVLILTFNFKYLTTPGNWPCRQSKEKQNEAIKC